MRDLFDNNKIRNISYEETQTQMTLADAIHVSRTNFKITVVKLMTVSVPLHEQNHSLMYVRNNINYRTLS